MTRAVLLAVLPVLLGAQQPLPGRMGLPPGFQRGGPPQQAEPFDPADACTVAGQVTNAATGEPLAKVTVTLRRSRSFGPGVQRNYAATSDASGNFVVTGVAPGSYQLEARRTGFVNAVYGARRHMGPGASLELGARERLEDVRLAMTPHAVMTGRVVAEDGEPLQYVQVQALRYSYGGGGKQWRTYGRAMTNDIGEYRMSGLPPGRYYVAASVMRTGERWMQGGLSDAEQAYVPTYYPGTVDPAAAAAIAVGAGEQLGNIDLRLAKSTTSLVRGRISPAPQATGRQRLMVLLRARGLAVAQMNQPAAVSPDGEFEFRGVAPGSYTLVAMVPQRGGGGLAARVPLEVGTAPVENLSVVMSPPLPVAGTVRISGQEAAAAGVRISLRPREPFGFGMQSLTATAEAGGAFTFPAVTPDRYDLAISGLPEGYYIQSATAAGRDVLLAGLDLTSGNPGPIQVVLGANAGQAGGLVQNDRQEPVPGATVVLVPQEEERRPVRLYYHAVTTDETGAFVLDNLAPGTYKVYGWTEVEPGAYYDPDFMRPFENAGESLTIREGSREEIKVRLIG